MKHPHWKRFFYKNLLLMKEPELALSIKQMKLHNWEQMLLTGDPRWMVIDQTKKDWPFNPEKFHEAYFALHDEYAQITGISEVMERWADLMTSRMDARAAAADGDKSQLNWVEYYTDQIDNLMRGNKDADIIKTRMTMQFYYKQPIREHEITVYDYLMICKFLEEKAAADAAKNPQENVEND